MAFDMEMEEYMPYVDGFLLTLPEDRLEEYRMMAEGAGQIWKEHGAVAFRECVSDDMTAEGMTPFPQVIRAKEGELVIFSYIVFNSREHRDQVNAKVMADPRIKDLCDEKNLPFDPSRMAYGGFNVIVDLP